MYPETNPNPMILLFDPLSTIGGLFWWGVQSMGRSMPFGSLSAISTVLDKPICCILRRSPINGPQYAVRIVHAISTVLDEPICCILLERICSPRSWCHPGPYVRTPMPLVSAVLPLFLFWLLPPFDFCNLHTQSDGMDRLAVFLFFF